MKKFICIILICLLLPLTSLIMSGCKNDSYDLKTFYTTYENITNDTPYLTLVKSNDTYNLDIDSNKIAINYDKATNLSQAVNSASSFKYIETLYQQLLDDTLAPVYFFGQKISSSNRVNKNQTKQLFQNLENLNTEYHELDYYLGILNNSLASTTNSTINLSHLKKVLLQYEKLLNAAGNLSSVVSNIYFNTILSISDFDYSTKDVTSLTSADLVKISIDTRAKMYYFKSIYANIYHQMFIKNSTISNDIISSNTPSLPSYEPHTYMSGVKSLNSRSFDSLIHQSSVVESIYEYSISLFNIQKNFDSAYAEFNLATSKISYANLNAKSTNAEKMYRKTIERFAYGISVDSYEVLKNLVSLLYY